MGIVRWLFARTDDDERRHREGIRWARRQVFIGVATLLITIAGIAVTIALANQQSPNPSADLELAEMRVVSDAEIKVLLTDLEDSSYSERIRAHDTGLDIKVHNEGKSVAVVTALNLHVDEVRTLELCDPKGDTLQITHVYDVELPDKPREGSTVQVPLSQEIAAGDADRFIVSIGGEQGVLYRLSGSLAYNSGREVELEPMLVASPFPRRDDYFLGTGDPECEQSNRETLNEMLDTRADRVRELDIVADPEAIREGIGEPSGPDHSYGLILEYEDTCGEFTTPEGDRVILRLESPGRDGPWGDDIECSEVFEIVRTYYYENFDPQQVSDQVQFEPWYCTTVSPPKRGIAGDCFHGNGAGSITMVAPLAE